MNVAVIVLKAMPEQCPDSRFGDWKDCWDIALSDMCQNPVWVDCMLISLLCGTEDLPEGGSEASGRPFTVSANVLPEFRHATILLDVSGLEMRAVGTYNVDTRNLTCVLVYNLDGSLAEYSILSFPLKLTSVPRIDGKEGVSFIENGENVMNAR